MTRKRKLLPILESVTIEAVAAEGKSLFRWNDLVVFVPFVIPGDVVDVQITHKKHSYAEGKVVRMVSPSPMRQQPFCEHFGLCGGCKWQMLPYEEQLKAKQQQVEDQLRRIGKIELPEFRTILGSELTQEYRNKLDFGCSNKRYLSDEQMRTLSAEQIAYEKSLPAIGFHMTGAFDKILPVVKCHLMDDRQNQIRQFVYDYAVAHSLTFFDLREQHGLLRDVIVRCSSRGEWMVILQFHYDDEQSEQQARQLLNALNDAFPYITSLLYLDNQKCNDTIGDQQIEVFAGRDHIVEQMGNLLFKVGPKSFYQTNTRQAKRLYEVARDAAELTGNELVYDLYTGTGTIACFVAHQARKVIGIEYVEEAIEDAKVNAGMNHIDNTLFFAGDMKDILTDDFINEHGRPDVIITDPPRAGMHPDVIKTILRARPKRIVYVSCNPATQARDLHDLAVGYRVEMVQPVDMFPHTPHVENVVKLVSLSE